jgi:hypothetical protein
MLSVPEGRVRRRLRTLLLKGPVVGISSWGYTVPRMLCVDRTIELLSSREAGTQKRVY